MASANGGDAPHIVLYFDVNKTVIMHDPVQGKGLHHILNDLLTERALGVVSKDGETWTWNGKPVIEAGYLQCGDHEARKEISYGTFLRAKYPMSSDPAESKHNKKMRKVLRQDFTSPGSPGEGAAHEHDVLLHKLQMPPHDCSDKAVVAAGLHDSPYHFIIPAFFRLIRFLHERGTKFNLVFRTYGDDLHRIAQEFNLFCSGRHPFFSPGAAPMDGTNGSIDRRLHLTPCNGHHRHGTFYRSDATTSLVMGTFQQPKSTSEDFTAFYDAVEGVEIVRGLQDVHLFLTKRWKDEQATLAIRDFYPHWFSKREDATAGKLMTIDPNDVSVHPIFFDDNILVHEPHIVDARRYPDGEALDWNSVCDLCLMHVEPLDAVRDEGYFIDRLTSSLQKRREKSE